MTREPTKTPHNVDAVIPKSREMEVRRELPDLFFNPQVRIRVVEDEVFQELIDKGTDYGNTDKRIGD